MSKVGNPLGDGRHLMTSLLTRYFTLPWQWLPSGLDSPCLLLLQQMLLLFFVARLRFQYLIGEVVPWGSRTGEYADLGLWVSACRFIYKSFIGCNRAYPFLQKAVSCRLATAYFCCCCTCCVVLDFCLLVRSLVLFGCCFCCCPGNDCVLFVYLLHSLCCF